MNEIYIFNLYEKFKQSQVLKARTAVEKGACLFLRVHNLPLLGSNYRIVSKGLEGEVVILLTDELVKDKDKLAQLDQVIAHYEDKPGQLIRVLQQAQQIFGYIPENVQCYVAERMTIPISEVAGVVSFYSLFSDKPKGKHTIGVCLGTACYVKGAQEILNAIKKELSIDVDQTTEDGLFTLSSTRCIGACGLAPVMDVDGEIYGRVKLSDVPGILDKYRQEAVKGGDEVAGPIH